MNPNQITLRAWYDDTFCSLFHGDARPATLAEYLCTLNVWEANTCNPTLDEVSNVTLAEFRNKISATRSPATANKHLRHINHLLCKAGPPGPHNRDALGVTGTTPWARPLRVVRNLPKVAGSVPLSLCYGAASQWFKTFLVCAFNLGTRLHALTHIVDDDIDWAERTIRFKAEHDKRGIKRIKPMNSIVIKHLIALRGRGLLQWTKSLSTFRRHWRLMQAEAALTKDQRFNPHDMKRACGTALATAGASTWAVRYMLDHAQRDVTGQSYINPIDELRGIVEILPQPFSLKKEHVETV